jgi:hypothetical protein
MRAALTLCVAALLLSACSQKAEKAEDAVVTVETASLFQSDIAPLFRSKCATCHLTGTEAGKMALTPQSAIANVVGVKSSEAPTLMRVAPGKPDESYLIMKLEGTHIEHGGTGATMPFGAPPLSKEQITKIRQWITEGAKP